MKNIHMLPTDKPSRLVKIKDNLFYTTTENIPSGNYQNIYITNSEEIKEGDWVLGDYPDNPIGKVISKYGEEFTMQSLNGNKHGLAQYDSKKIILTTDVDLIKDGVQSIDDEFLEWFVKNPSCEEVVVGYGFIKLTETDNKGYWVSIPDEEFNMKKEEPKQETLKEVKQKIKGGEQ